MPAESTIVLLPRFTSLTIGDGGSETFSTLPLDVSRFGGAQFQFVVNAFKSQANPWLDVYLEESLDGEVWVLGASAPRAVPMVVGSKFFSYSFRLRWFRLRAEVKGINTIVTCWCEGLLR